MRDSIIEKLYNYKITGNLTEEGYKTAMTILQNLNQRLSPIDEYFLYEEDNVVLEIHKNDYKIFIDFKSDNTIWIYKLSDDFSGIMKDFDQLDDMYEYLNALL